MIGQFFTPAVVSDCMFRAAGVRPGQRVMDPSCGDGSFLRVAPRGVDLHGCEIDLRYVSVVQSLLPPGRLVAGDALTSLVSLWGQCDLVIGNPPYSAQASLEKRPEVLRGFDLGAGRPSQCLEVLFLELFMKLAKPHGRIAIILPDGPLSNRPFQYVRNWLLCRSHVEAVISLPRGIFSRTPAKTNIIIAQKRPLAAQLYRDPTLYLECNTLEELRPLRLRAWEKVEPRWKRIVLADVDDWRPEAQGGGCGLPAKTVRLADLFRLRTGFALYGPRRQFVSGPGAKRFLLLRAKNISREGGLQLSRDCAYISRDTEMFCEQSVVRPGEIVFVRVGAGCCGRTALVPPGLRAQADDWLHVFTPLVEVDAAGLVGWFNSDSGRTAVRRLAKGVGTLSISKSSLAELRVPSRFMKSNRLVLDGGL